MSETTHQQLLKIREHPGFVAALDQSGGSTPRALASYGVGEDAYSSEDEMFDLMHDMRSRIITSPSFGGERIIGAILFEMTMDRDIEGRPSSEYLWDVKEVVPFLKVDNGLADEDGGVQMMKPIPELPGLLAKARDHGIFGTKMRSVIKDAKPAGVEAIADQQFSVGLQILDSGMVPIIEPEVDIHSETKAEAETLLKSALLARLDALADSQEVMLKLTIPDEDNFYRELIEHPRVLRVVALSGGYTRDEANSRLVRNNGMVASFSRALAEGLSAQQGDDEFDATLDSSIQSIFEAGRS